MSRTTVSLALRGNSRISSETIEKIARIADEMGYACHPYLSAWMQQMRRRQPVASQPSVAYLSPWNPRHLSLQHPTQRRFFRGAVERAAARGFRLDPFWFNDPAQKVEALLRTLYHRGVDGLLVTQGFPEISADLLTPFAVVAVGYWSERFYSAVNDQVGAIRLALSHVSASGFKRPGLVFWPSTDVVVRHAYYDSFLGFASRRGLHGPFALALKDGTKRNETIFLDWLRNYRPDVIVSHKTWPLEMMSQPAFPRLPRPAFINLNVVKRGVSDGCDQRSEAIGESAMELLEELLLRNERGALPFPKTVLVPGQWVRVANGLER